MTILHNDFDLLDAVRQRLALHMGLHFPPERTSDLERGIEHLARMHGYDHTDDFIHHFVSTPLTKSQIQQLATQVTIGETYFFREPGLFDLLRTDLLPQIIAAQRQADRRIRLWSVGCAGGEEAYSLAILLNELLPSDEAWDALVMGMDINPEAIQKGEVGIYSDWSFRNPPVGLRERHFDRTPDGRFVIKPWLRSGVRFSYCNLADTAAPMLYGAADLILCRNVLMYFVPTMAHEAACRLAHALKAGGWLLTTPAEASLIPADCLNVEIYEGHTVHRKARDKPMARRTGQQLAAALPKRYSQSPKPKAKTQQSPQVTRESILAMGNQGRLTEALALCQHAIDNDRKNPDWHYLQATLLQELARPGMAISSLENALRLDPTFIMAHVMLGGLHRRMRRINAALYHLRTARELLHRLPSDIVPSGSDGLNAQRIECMLADFMSTLEAGHE